MAGIRRLRQQKRMVGFMEKALASSPENGCTDPCFPALLTDSQQGASSEKSSGLGFKGLGDEQEGSLHPP